MAPRDDLAAELAMSMDDELAMSMDDELAMSMDDELPLWMDEHGLHALVPGIPDAATFARLTERYQQKIRNSPLWDDMVREFGLEQAEQLLKEFRAQPG